MNRSTPSTIIGILGGFAALVAGFLIEGGVLGSLFSLSALIIIVGTAMCTGSYHTIRIYQKRIWWGYLISV